MDIKFNISGVQEGKKYVLEFCIKEEDNTKPEKKQVQSAPSSEKKKKGPSLEDFEQQEKPPQLEEIKSNKPKEFKVESSFSGKINPV